MVEGGPSGTTEQEQTYHQSEVARAYDPQYLYRMELEKFAKEEILEKYLELHVQHHVLEQSKNTSEIRRVTDESHEHPVKTIRPEIRLHPARNVQLEYEKRINAQVMLQEARARTVALDHAQQAIVRAD